ncbi:MAG TPA: formate dehydrogenase accessory protein FdhE [Rubrivivax sp.]|nr:formate dehydrogenase accessory protein FdhE [Rubrivivax sp.]HRY87807.1 formate dehydrogenase accessory protein FdhE [Rubrivivax sp.]HRZ60338.1 formate dehydrogenase accessory protein FdhE [Rubrivivax sp.]
MTTHDPDPPHSSDSIALRAGMEIPRLLLPEPGRVFAQRALRLRQLAAGHAMRDYLMLLALVCEAQHARVQQGPAPALPAQAQRDAAARAGEPLLNAVAWPRDPQWRIELRALAADVLARMPADSPARAAVQGVAGLADAALEQQAERLLAGITLGLDMGAAPLIAAGLQLYFTRLAAACGALPADAAPERATHCPCCGSLPVASLTRLGGQQEGQRYQHCTLCSTQWHADRVRCTHCGATDGLQYLSLQAAAASADDARKRPVVEAETCDHCGHYLKIMHAAGDLHVEPVADDLATLTLDLLVADAGFSRHGANLLLLFGEAESAPA